MQSQVWSAVSRFMSVRAVIFFIVYIVFYCVMLEFSVRGTIKICSSLFPVSLSAYAHFDVQCFDLYSCLDFSACLNFSVCFEISATSIRLSELILHIAFATKAQDLL